MDEALKVVVEMLDWSREQFQQDLRDMTPEEADWRPLPEANSINLILRHLRIEAAWHRSSIEQGTGSAPQQAGPFPLDFEENLKKLDELFAGFVKVLRETTLTELEQRNEQAYQESAPGRTPPPHFLAYHQAMHLAMHWGQIRTLRNLYRKARGEPARFFPENPTFPT